MRDYVLRLHIGLKKTLGINASIVLKHCIGVILATTELFDTYLLNLRKKMLIALGLSLAAFLMGRR
jgi:hypothetical protein